MSFIPNDPEWVDAPEGWEPGDPLPEGYTPVSAARLNHIEQGLVELSALVGAGSGDTTEHLLIGPGLDVEWASGVDDDNGDGASFAVRTGEYVTLFVSASYTAAGGAKTLFTLPAGWRPIHPTGITDASFFFAVSFDFVAGVTGGKAGRINVSFTGVVQHIQTGTDTAGSCRPTFTTTFYVGPSS